GTLLAVTPSGPCGEPKTYIVRQRRNRVMGLFDKMFGSGASTAEQQSNSTQQFDKLKLKYQSVLNTIDQQQIQLQNLHVQDNKLFIKGVGPSQDAVNKIWDQIKLADP